MLVSEDGDLYGCDEYSIEEKRTHLALAGKVLLCLWYTQKHVPVRGDLAPLSPLVTRYHSLLGLTHHEKYYFWTKLNLGFLRKKENNVCVPSSPSKIPFSFF